MTTQRRTPAVKGAVVVGVDASRAGTQAVDWAAHQAALEHRGLVLVHATGTLGTTGTTWLDSADPDRSPGIAMILQEGAAVLSPAVRRVCERHPELDVDTYVATEDPAPELRRLTDDAHLLVVGSRGGSLLRHLPTWQVGARVAGRAACPVVVVPAHDTEVVRQGVLVGADLSNRAGPVLRFAYRLASLHEQPLTVVHLARERHDQVDAERFLAESVAGMREEFPDVHADLRVLHGSPAARLVRMADRKHILVVGRHHQLGTYETLVGHVHASVVDRSPCPVAVVPLRLDDERQDTGRRSPSHSVNA